MFDRAFCRIPGRFVAAALVLLVCGLAGCQQKQEDARLPVSVRQQKVKPPVERPAGELIASQEAFIEVSEKVTPAVVNISAERVAAQGVHPFIEEFFGDLFKDQPRPRRRSTSLGSGFILTADGYILTNDHVIHGAENIKVKLTDQREFPGKVVGSDPRTDVAVIKVETDQPLPTVVLGDSGKLKVGQWALAIGNPFGLDRTLTVGVISATGRANVGIEEYEDFIQTDASINPGNSGGPLLNIYGEVVGINTAVVASGQGIGFAIPVDLARLIADQLIATGKVTRGWLGVKIQPLTPDLAESFGLERTTGALISEVLEGAPAQKAGLKRGDVLLTFNGREVRGVRELQLLVASTPAGASARMELLRDGKQIVLDVLIAVRDAEETAAAPEPDRSKWQGLHMAPGEDGLVVSEVEAGSAAAAAGVQAGDIVLSVNGFDVSDLESLAEAKKRINKERPVRLLIRRDGAMLYLAFDLD